MPFIFKGGFSYAGNAEGEMTAVLIDPLTMVDLDQAKRFCEEEPQVVSCDLLQERLNAEQDRVEDQVTYTVFNTNFE